MAVKIKISLNENLYLRDPQATDLGQNLIRQSILLFDEVGFERFNFKELAKRMQSTEASVYRYFANKNVLLIYLVSWHQEFVSYLIDINSHNLSDPQEKLKIVINTLVYPSRSNISVDYVDAKILHRVVIYQGVKAYRSERVDSQNKQGFFLDYKNLTAKISAVIREVAPDFPYPNTLASSLFEMVNDNIYFANHLPRLTDISVSEENYDEVEKMLNFFAFSVLKQ